MMIFGPKVVLATKKKNRAKQKQIINNQNNKLKIKKSTRFLRP